MHILFLLAIVPYFIIVISFIIGWFRKTTTATNTNRNAVKVSVIIPVRDEANNIPILIEDIQNQTYPHSLFEVLFVDDHSTDGTSLLLQKYCNLFPFIKTISLTDEISGKKRALWCGIKSSEGELIITTDGDCRFKPRWLETMVAYYSKFPGHLLIGPVFIRQNSGLFNHFQCLEFLSLIASGAGAAGLGHPILCNGANLGGDKSLFQRASKIYQSEISSGDDIFLMLELKRQHVPAVFVKNNEAVVETVNSNNLKGYFNQRTRWTFKSKHYRDPDIILVALIVLLTNLFFAGGLVFSIFHKAYLADIFLFYILKSIADFFLLYYVAKFFKREQLLRFFLIHQLLYVFYVSIIGIVGQFSVFKWKSRT